MNERKNRIIGLGIACFFVILYGAAVILGNKVFKDEEETSDTAYQKSSIQFRLETDKGLKYMNESKYDDALQCFIHTLDMVADEPASRQDECYSIVYNNLSYAYYWLGENDLSLTYSEKALALGENDAIEYLNYANALYDASKLEEALENYETAINLDHTTYNAYYGKGLVLYDQKDYKTSKDTFQYYLIYQPDDLDAELYVAYCEIYLKQYEQANTLLATLISENRDNLNVLDAKGELLLQSKGADAASAYYKNLADEYSDDVTAQIMYGSFLYNEKDYEAALEFFTQVRSSFSEDETITSWIVHCYFSMENIKGAVTYYNDMIEAGHNFYKLNKAMGDNYYKKTMYQEAIFYYDASLQLQPELYEAYQNKLYSLYYAKRYSKCLETAKEAKEKFPNAYDIAIFVADSYYFLNDYEEAIKAYQNAYEIQPDNDNLPTYISECYLLLDDYDMAQKYADEALAMNSENTYAVDIVDSITDRKKPVTDQLTSFIKEYYLYYEEMDGVETSLAENFKEDDMTNKEIAVAVDQIKQSDDIFTYTIYDEDYAYYSGDDTDEVFFTSNENIAYLRIDSFCENTYHKVVSYLDEIEDSENTTLVIDLRSNGGGLTNTSNNILDCLLPECVTCTLIYRDGETYNYYSNASQITFDHIFILVDGYTASAAELLTLGLDTYLKNVTIIGTPTFGKGVGQVVYEDSKRQLAVFVVNHYWNVKQQNVMHSSIKPDIYLDSDDIEDYLKVVYEEMKHK